MRPDPRRAAVLLALLALALAGCARRSADEDDTAVQPVVEVAVAGVQTRTFRTTVDAPGQWRSTGEVVVAAPFTAYVESVAVNVGDVVARGSVLGTLVTRDSRAAVLGATQLLAGAHDTRGADEARRALAQAQADLVRVPLLASAAGTVVRRGMTPGGEAAEGAELLAIVPARALVFEAHVPAEAAARVQPGQPAAIAVEGVDTVAAAVQRRLPQTAAADQSALVWLAPAGAPAPGLIDRFGIARIVLGGARRAPAAPLAALVEDDLTGEIRMACVDSAGRARWTPVQPGDTADGWRELRGAAPPAGTRVIVRGQHGLPEGTRVKIVP